MQEQEVASCCAARPAYLQDGCFVEPGGLCVAKEEPGWACNVLFFSRGCSMFGNE